MSKIPASNSNVPLKISPFLYLAIAKPILKNPPITGKNLSFLARLAIQVEFLNAVFIVSQRPPPSLPIPRIPLIFSPVQPKNDLVNSFAESKNSFVRLFCVSAASATVSNCFVLVSQLILVILSTVFLHQFLIAATRSPNFVYFVSSTHCPSIFIALTSIKRLLYQALSRFTACCSLVADLSRPTPSGSFSNKIASSDFVHHPLTLSIALPNVLSRRGPCTSFGSFSKNKSSKNLYHFSFTSAVAASHFFFSSPRNSAVLGNLVLSSSRYSPNLNFFKSSKNLPSFVSLNQSLIALPNPLIPLPRDLAALIQLPNLNAAFVKKRPTAPKSS